LRESEKEGLYRGGEKRATRKFCCGEIGKGTFLSEKNARIVPGTPREKKPAPAKRKYSAGLEVY